MHDAEHHSRKLLPWLWAWYGALVGLLFPLLALFWGDIHLPDLWALAAFWRTTPLFQIITTAPWVLGALSFAAGRWHRQSLNLRDELSQLIQRQTQEIASLHEQYRIQAELIDERDKKYRQIVELAQEGIWVISAQWETLYVNKSMANMLGYAEQEMIGMNLTQFMDEQGLAEARANAQSQDENGPMRNQPFRFKRKEGGDVYTLMSATPLYTAAGDQIEARIGMFVDMTAEKLAQDRFAQLHQELMHEKELLQAIFDHMPMMIMVMDEQRRPLIVNQCLEKSLDFDLKTMREQQPQYTRYECFESSVRSEARHFAEQVFNQWRDFEMSDPGGEGVLHTRWMNLKLSNDYTLHIGQDITQKRRTELEKDQMHQRLRTVYEELELKLVESKNLNNQLRTTQFQLLQVQKLDAIGKLAGGVAHEFNNLLATILGYASMLTEQFADRPRALRQMNIVKESAERGAELTKKLLGFARSSTHEKRRLSVTRVAEDNILQLQRLLKPGTTLQLNLAPDVFECEGDSSQIAQLLINLVSNACEAMPQGGVIRLESFNHELTAPEAEALQLRIGAYACLAVIDGGAGVDPAIQHRIFDPFFTTKAIGSGSGLGLSLVYGIMQNHGGTVMVDSSPGQGTTLTAYFPAVQAPL